MSNNRQESHSDSAGRRRERPGRPRPPQPEAQDETLTEAFEEEGAGIAAKE